MSASAATSTLVETINIDADDFTDNFLTCPTCMGAYDDGEHTPKLLPCSHTLCRQCLERIASSTAVQIQTTETAVSASPAGLLAINNSLSRSIAAADAAMASMNPSNEYYNNTPLLNINNSSRLSNSSIISNASRPNGPTNGASGTQVVTDLCIRCPICRETIILPRNGGIFNLPPSFIINQLIDLVKSRRSRDVIPRCVNHTNEELLYCETCDKAFCSICESHFTVATNADHIIIPFSIALKRITEIYLFKSSQCLNSFSLALGNVQREIANLNSTVESVAGTVEASFDELKALVDRRKQQVLADLRRIRDAKAQVLNDQVKLIVNEKQKVENELKQYEQLNGHVMHTGVHGNAANNSESKSLGTKIQNINEKLDCLRTLCEPRENSFISYEFLRPPQQVTVSAANSNELFDVALRGFGRFKTSNTYPPLCSARVVDDSASTANGTVSSPRATNGHGYQSGASPTVYETLSRQTNGHSVMGNGMNGGHGGSGASGGNYPANLTVRLQIETVDYYGNKQKEGGDPITSVVTDPMGRQQVFKSPTDITDCGNGLYQFKIVPNLIGKTFLVNYSIYLYIGLIRFYHV
jgi:hypothetical protein